ncbi:hypothetical protein JOE30_001555 [Rhodococcus sp. PvP016]|uniref:Uncharacterized protein n=1 Tax=Rhodococcoides corynebacterioides TaxID=53972 RepID=A0ABS2KMU1_9NOCA|nr:hypothetical protein [Rhodococcus corynebacterioides]MBP1115758.1 hypothetical protein [Rhodococcus sp. PvP016]
MTLFTSLKTRMIRKGQPSFNDIVIDAERRRARKASEA